MPTLVTIIDEPEKMDIDMKDVVVLTDKNHRNLSNLDYENSGHTGFASKEDLNNVLNKIQANSFTYKTLSELGSAFGIDVSSVEDEYSVTTSKINYRGKDVDLSNGDSFYIVQTDVPDYWFSLDDMKLYKQETKVEPGIETIEGTDENPINFANLEIGKLYYLNGKFFYNTLTKETVYGVLAFKTANNCIRFFAAALYGGSIEKGAHEIVIYFNSASGAFSARYVSVFIAGINGGISEFANIYAPKKSGTSGQILQSNGSNQAPTWITPNFATIDDVNNAIGNVSSLLGDTEDLEV